MEIIIVKTDNISFADIEEYLSCVSSARRSVVLKKSSDTDRVQSLVAGLLLRSEISKRTGVPTTKISFVKGPHGKPYLNGGEVQFSISHTKGAVCVAVGEAADGEIGVDIERCDRRASDRLKERVLCENERMFAYNDEGFIRIWVKKEAFLKRMGIGVATDLKGADTTILPDTVDVFFDDYFVGISGKNATDTHITSISVEELLSRFTTRKK